MLPEFILLPGFHGNSCLFRPLLKVLPARVLELPERGPQDYDTLASWLSTQRFPKPYILVGESYAGPVSLLHAAQRPNALRGLALLGSFARIRMPMVGLAKFLVPPLPLGWPLFRNFLDEMLFNGKGDAKLLDELQTGFSKTGARILRARLQVLMQGDVRMALSEIHVPVLAVTARDDRMVPLKASEDFSWIPKLRRLTLDSPHVIGGTHPRALAAALIKFRALCTRRSSNMPMA